MQMGLLSVLLLMRNRRTIELTKLLPRKVLYNVVKDGITRGDLPECPEPGGWSEELIDFSGVAGSLVKYNAIACWLEMQTLGCKLLRAPLGSFFITSDSPVVMLNQLLNPKSTYRSYVGFGRSGFQLVLPLSSKQCIFFFDPRAYKVGTRKAHLVDLSPADVELLNSLQIQAAEECVFFDSPSDSSMVSTLVSRYCGLRASNESCITETSGPSPDQTLLHAKRPIMKLVRPWSFCTFLKSKSFGEGYRRNSGWSDLITEACEEMITSHGHDTSAILASMLARSRSLAGNRD